MFLSGDSTITPRDVLDRGWTMTIQCGRWQCGTRGAALRLAPWPRFYDTPIVDLYFKMTCSKCGRPAVEVVVSRFTGRGSEIVEVLKVAEKME